MLGPFPRASLALAAAAVALTLCVADDSSCTLSQQEQFQLDVLQVHEAMRREREREPKSPTCTRNTDCSVTGSNQPAEADSDGDDGSITDEERDLIAKRLKDEDGDAIEAVADGAEDSDEDEQDDNQQFDWITRINEKGEEEELRIGVRQDLSPQYEHLRPIWEERMDKVDDYMWESYNDPEVRPLIDSNHHQCSDRDASCLQAALLGDCERLPYQMMERCGPSCMNCDKMLYQRRCPYDNYAPEAWAPGDLDRMFSRIVAEANGRYSDYDVTVWSQPEMTDAEIVAHPDGMFADKPWVLSFENLLKDDEVERLLELAEADGYERSDDGGEYIDGKLVTYYTKGRTSYNSWCAGCDNDPHGRDVLARIEEITDIPRTNFELMQMLRYQKTQHYHLHHDLDHYEVPRQPGPRIATFFLYLSDVEEGGETHFPHLNLTFTPKRGRALLWPNVLDFDPFSPDPRTEHQAMPVVKGIKFAANIWAHQHDWVGPASRGCDS